MSVWWRLFGDVPPVGPKCERVLFYVSLAFFWELYDLSLSMSALSHIAREFEVERSRLAYSMSFIRFGAFPALLCSTFADRYGRRVMFVASVCGISLFTCCTAFSLTVEDYIVYQMICRCFVELCSATGFVIVAEVFPAEHRGWGMGILGATGALGFGMGAVLFAFVDHLPYGWRALYFIGILPVTMLPLLLREIPETDRFKRMQHSAAPRSSAASLLCTHTTRVLAVVAACVCFSAGNSGVFQFSGYYVLGVKKWLPWHLSVLVISAGGLGVFGNVAVGRLGDRRGRKPIAVVITVLYPVMAFAFYHSDGLLLALAWASLTLASVVMNVLVRTLSTEVFPTEARGTAGGVVSTSNAVGSVIGLTLIGMGTEKHDMPTVVSAVAVFAAAAGFALLALPETSGKDLEQLNRTPSPVCTAVGVEGTEQSFYCDAASATSPTNRSAAATQQILV
eukprot:Rhum_TRINITY_DN2232_c0_g2::Rhum_TRINITY_DN2232_c0_g2_i1::g.6475::m.6475